MLSLFYTGKGIFLFFAFSAVEHFLAGFFGGFLRISEDIRGFQRILEDIRGFYRTFEDFGGFFLDFAEGIFGFCWGIGDFLGSIGGAPAPFPALKC